MVARVQLPFPVVTPAIIDRMTVGLVIAKATVTAGGSLDRGTGARNHPPAGRRSTRAARRPRSSHLVILFSSTRAAQSIPPVPPADAGSDLESVR